jgi:hypothetical protein
LQAPVCTWTYANGEQNTIGAALCSSSENCADCCADVVVAYSLIHRTCSVLPACALGQRIWYYYTVRTQELASLIGTIPLQ